MYKSKYKRKKVREDLPMGMIMSICILGPMFILALIAMVIMIFDIQIL
jgi:hypothetical protein